MDPNTVLLRARSAAQAVLDTPSNAYPEALVLAEAFDALDRWLSNGGFCPKAWQRKSEEPPHTTRKENSV
jgi:hypothetical protein